MIRPLIQVTTTPARLEYQVQRAKLQMEQQQPTAQRTVKRAQLNMRRQAGRFEMNTVRRRSDMGFKGVVDRANYEADLGRQQASKTTAQKASLGNALLNFHKGANIPDALWSQQAQEFNTDLVLQPVSPAEIRYVPAQLEADYVPGEMQTDWNVGKARLDFVPGSFNINITQYASISFEYTGGFNYVPRSADPNFQASA